MQVKVQCPCGTRFAFEVEPLDGHMPGPVACPGCGADATALANAAIAAQLSAAPAESAGLPEGGTETGRAHGEAVRPRLRVARPGVAQVEPQTDSAVPPGRCPHHPNEPAVEQCRVCGRPICPRCMELHGYTCSVFCRTRAEQEQIPLPHYAGQRQVAQQTARRRVRLALFAAGAVILVLLGVWAWWTWVGSKPRVVFTQPLGEQSRDVVCELVSPTEILMLQARRLALLDLTLGRERWAVPVEAPARAPALSLPARPAPPARSADVPPLRADSPLTGLLDDVDNEPPQAPPADVADAGLSALAEPRLLHAGDELWLALPDRVVALDRRTGERRRDIPLAQPVTALSQHETAIVAVSGGPGQVRTVTMVKLPGGAVTTAQVAPVGAAASPASGVRSAAGPKPDAVVGPAEGSGLPEEFVAAGPNVVHMQARLLERRVARRPAAGRVGAESLLESGRLTAGQSLDAARELLAEMRRDDSGGVVEEDTSRYRVTLRRVCGETVADWTGEVEGPPRLVALRTVDVLLGAQELVVFGKNNTRRWAAKLTRPLPRNVTLPAGGGAGRTPCVESADALYVFDEGMLTCFELAGGQARWRLTRPGISAVQPDDAGGLYVTTTTAGAAQTGLGQPLGALERPQPVILKLDAASGRVLWQLIGQADRCILSGRFVYAARASSGLLAPGAYFNLFRLDPKSGRQLWHYHADRWPRYTSYSGNRFLLQWPEAVEVFRFRTF